MEAVYQEQEIIRRFRAGEEAAFKQLFEQHFGPVLHYAQHILQHRNDAEDIVLDIFYKLWKHRDEFASLDHVKGFLYKSTRFACINLLRQWQSRGRQTEVLLERAMNESFSDSRLVLEELLQEVIIEINRLPQKYATILQLKYLHDMDYAAIALQMGLSEATVRKQKQRAIELLQTSLLKKKLLTVGALITLLERIYL